MQTKNSDIDGTNQAGLPDAKRPAPAGDNVARPAALDMRKWASENINMMCGSCSAPRPWIRHFGQCKNCGVDTSPVGITWRDKENWRRWVAWLNSDERTPFPHALEEVKPKRRRRAA